MKRLILVILSVSICSVLLAGTASKVKTATFKVYGVCGMCEKRIEKAALIKGVKMAEWDKHTQKLTVHFSGKFDVKDVHKAVAKVGHDTELEKAEDDVYQSLPNCCKYRDGREVH